MSIKDELAALKQQKTGGSTRTGQRGPVDDAMIKRLQGDQSVDTPPAAPDEGGIIKGLIDALYHTGVGVAKGAGDTANNLGAAVNKIPLVGDVTTGLGNALGGAAGKLMYGEKAAPVDAATAHATASKDLEAKGGAEQVGKFGEQMGEFFVPAGPAEKAMTGPLSLAHLIPNGASPSTMKLLNKAAAILGRSAGQGASAAGVSLAHGDDPDLPAALGAAGPLVGAAGEAALPLLASSKTLQEILPWIAGGAAGTAANSALGPMGGLGTGMAVRGVARAATRKLISNPKTLKAGATALRKGTELAGRTGASMVGPTRKALRAAPYQQEPD